MKQCSMCEKTSVVRGKRKLLRGHYNPVNKSKKFPNLQWVTVGGVRKKMCTKCMKTLSKKSK